MFFKYYILGRCVGAITNPTGNFNCKLVTRKFKRKLFSTRSSKDNPDFERSLTQNLRHSFCDEKLEILQVDISISLYAYAILEKVVSDPKLNLSVVILFEQFSHGQKPSGFGITRVFPCKEVVNPSLEFLPYLQCHGLILPPVLSSCPSGIPSVFDMPANGAIVSSIRSLWMSIVNDIWLQDSRVFSNDHILLIINSFLPDFFDWASFTPTLRELIFRSAFIEFDAPEMDYQFQGALWNSVQPHGRRRYHSRTHRLFADNDQFYYWWDSLYHSEPYNSSPFPPPLRTWKERVEHSVPQAAMVPHSFLAAYDTRKSKLNLHSDCELMKYLKDYELVILSFVGGPRDLLVVPQVDKYGEFQRTFTCSRDKLIVMTPYANRHFFHGKLPARSDQPSKAATIAFRKAIHLSDALRIYPEISRHVVQIGPEGVAPITPAN